MMCQEAGSQVPLAYLTLLYSPRHLCCDAVRHCQENLKRERLHLFILSFKQLGRPCSLSPKPGHLIVKGNTNRDDRDPIYNSVLLQEEQKCYSRRLVYKYQKSSWARFSHSKEFLEFRKARSNMLLSRKNQLLLEFSFWNEPVPRSGPNIYELRSYQLRVSTEI